MPISIIAIYLILNWYKLPNSGKIYHMDYNTNAEIGESEEYLSFQEAVSKVAKVDRPVLLIGERGTGKELAARRLHYMSKRWKSPLITVNCASLSPSLIESELFGYERGAFTGAFSTRKGRFEEAEGGTLFLDEIGLVPLEVQEKILRVVEYGTYERVGSSETLEANVRIVGATNADLVKLCKEGKFKKDLLDRLSFEVLFLPPLRRRGDDILLLASYFASRMAMEIGEEKLPHISKKVEKELLEYNWPGNVRELKNVIERAVYRDGVEINHIDLNPFDNPYKESADFKDVSSINLKNFKKEHENLDLLYLKKALEMANHNQRDAALLLDLTYDQFRGLYRKYKDVI